MSANTSWTFERMAIVLAIGVQLGGWVWWTATTSADARYTERRLSAIEQSEKTIEQDLRAVHTELATLRARMEAANQTLGRIEANLNRRAASATP